MCWCSQESDSRNRFFTCRVHHQFVFVSSQLSENLKICRRIEFCKQTVTEKLDRKSFKFNSIFILFCPFEFSKCKSIDFHLNSYFHCLSSFFGDRKLFSKIKQQPVLVVHWPSAFYRLILRIRNLNVQKENFKN